VVAASRRYRAALARSDALLGADGGKRVRLLLAFAAGELTGAEAAR
jgi:hypothetical protein